MARLFSFSSPLPFSSRIWLAWHYHGCPRYHSETNELACELSLSLSLSTFLNRSWWVVMLCGIMPNNNWGRLTTMTWLSTHSSSFFLFPLEHYLCLRQCQHRDIISWVSLAAADLSHLTPTITIIITLKLCRANEWWLDCLLLLLPLFQSSSEARLGWMLYLVGENGRNEKNEKVKKWKN